MNTETKHLIHWWFEWLKRLALTTFHIVNRPAYHRWKARRDARRYSDWVNDPSENLVDNDLF